MANKKYTLYFKGINKYGHEHDFPMLSLSLKEMDIYTSNYKDYSDLFKSLPSKVSTFIMDNLSSGIDLTNNEDLEKCFFITDNDFTPIMEVIFDDDIDVLYVTSKELEELLIKQKMSYEEFQKSLMKINNLTTYKRKYDFFKYVYENYVKDQKVLCMIDDYDVKKSLSNLDYDNLIIASIATDTDNIKVLSKKLSQTLESRRNLAFKFKKLFNSLESNGRLISYEKLIARKNTEIEVSEILDNMLSHLEKFKTKYNKDYE